MTSCYLFTLSLWKRAESFEKRKQEGEFKVNLRRRQWGAKERRQAEREQMWKKILHRKKKKKKKVHRELKTEVRRLSREVPTGGTAGENSCWQQQIFLAQRRSNTLWKDNLGITKWQKAIPKCRWRQEHLDWSSYCSTGCTAENKIWVYLYASYCFPRKKKGKSVKEEGLTEIMKTEAIIISRQIVNSGKKLSPG